MDYDYAKRAKELIQEREAWTGGYPIPAVISAPGLAAELQAAYAAGVAERDAEHAKGLERLTTGDLARKGGEWLGVARKWIQRKARNGESVTWGSHDVLEMYVTVEKIESLAAEVAASAMRPQPTEERASTLLRKTWTQAQEIERLTRERDEARANYAFMVQRAADGANGNPPLSGYREMGETAAKAELGRDEARAEVAALRQIISDAAREVGAQVSTSCSLEFLAMLPREIALALRRAERTAHAAGVAEERARWAPAAAAARSALGKYAYDTGYGFFIGGDPRRFSPDEESSTSEEIAAWEVACTEAEADEKARDLSSPCGLETVEHEGRMVPAFVDRAPFGLGTYECGDDEAKAACEAITALLGDVAALGEAGGGR